MTSRSAEQYLKLLFSSDLPEQNTVSRLARALGVTPASVTGMVKRMAVKGLLQHQAYGAISLTPEGRDAAVRLLRRHRIAELYLYDRLAYPLYLVHDEADALEHHMSDYLEEKMTDALGNPSFDPHGHPIPQPDGSLTAAQGHPLAEAASGEELLVAAVPDHDALFLRHLVEIGCIPGRSLLLVERTEEADALRVRLDGEEHSIALDLAAGIRVCDTGQQQVSCFDDFIAYMRAERN